MRTSFRNLMLALLLVIAATPSHAANPLTGMDDATAAEASPQVERAWAPVAAVGRALLTFQRESSRLIAKHMRAIRQGETSAPLVFALGLAFLYGVVHALGPGHGKLVVMSYFLSREARIGRGLLMGLQIAVFHVISAIVVVALADLLLRQALGGPPAEVASVRLASYGLILSIGLVMLVQAIRRSRLRRAGIEVSYGCCDQGNGHGADHDRSVHAERRRQGALSLGVGIVPCTGAVLILLYAVANDILLAGVALVMAIALGMAITMGALGVLSVIARSAVAARVEASSDGSGRLAVVTDYAGALMITMIGAALLWGALQL